jgi:hypothetical protein
LQGIFFLITMIMKNEINSVGGVHYVQSKVLVRPEIVSHMLHPFENLLSSVCLTSDQMAAFIGFDI